MAALGVPARVCVVCARASAIYRCPRCNTPYCSLDCFRAHGETCTEAFYEAQVKEHLRATGDAPPSLPASAGAAPVDTDVLRLARGLEGPPSAAAAATREEELLAAAFAEATAIAEEAGGGRGGARAAAAAPAMAPDRLLTFAHKLFAADAADGSAAEVLSSLTNAERRSFLRAVASGSLSGVAHAGVEAGPWWLAPPVAAAAAASVSSPLLSVGTRVATACDDHDDEGGDDLPPLPSGARPITCNLHVQAVRAQAGQHPVQGVQEVAGGVTAEAPLDSGDGDDDDDTAEAAAFAALSMDIAGDCGGPRIPCVAWLIAAEPPPGFAAADTTGSVASGLAVTTSAGGCVAPLPPMSKLLRGTPSPLLPHHLAQVVYAYAHVYRLYAGDWADDAPAAAAALLHIAGVLARDARFETTALALTAAAAAAADSSVRLAAPAAADGARAALAALEDVYAIASDRHLLVDAVVHVCALLQQAAAGDREAAGALASAPRSRAAPGGAGGTGRAPASTAASSGGVPSLAAAQRKAHFYAAYANDAAAFTDELQEALLRDTWALAMEQASMQAVATKPAGVRVV